ncbi:hypothetical protein V8F20_010692 [Naviculisporaceae sp. PSN 640]
MPKNKGKNKGKKSQNQNKNAEAQKSNTAGKVAVRVAWIPTHDEYEPMDQQTLLGLLEPSPYLANWVNSPQTRTLGGAILLLNSIEWVGLSDVRYIGYLESLLGFTLNLFRFAAVSRSPDADMVRFRALAVECLKRGDPTPLLLTLPSDEKNRKAKWSKDEPGLPPLWLEGYTKGEKPEAWKVWDMGEVYSLGGVVDILGSMATAAGGNNNPQCLIDYEECKIMPDMMSVGYIESIQRDSFGKYPVIENTSARKETNRAAEVLDAFASLIVKTAPYNATTKQYEVTAEELVQGIDRCLPKEQHRIKAKHEVKPRGSGPSQGSLAMPGSTSAVDVKPTGSAQIFFPATTSSAPTAEAIKEILDLFKQYIPLVPAPGLPNQDEILDTIRDQKREKITHQLVACMNLMSRMKAAQREMSFNGEDNDWECIARVRCRSCQKVMVYRITAWEYSLGQRIRTTGPQEKIAQLWRFPGLELGECTADGVGLVVQERRIIGKMRYGSGGCGCVDMEHVDLGPYTSEGFYDPSDISPYTSEGLYDPSDAGSVFKTE